MGEEAAGPDGGGACGGRGAPGQSKPLRLQLGSPRARARARVVTRGGPGAPRRPWRSSWRLSWKQRCELFVCPKTTLPRSHPRSRPHSFPGTQPEYLPALSVGAPPRPERTTSLPSRWLERPSPRENRSRSLGARTGKGNLSVWKRKFGCGSRLPYCILNCFIFILTFSQANRPVMSGPLASKVLLPPCAARSRIPEGRRSPAPGPRVSLAHKGQPALAHRSWPRGFPRRNSSRWRRPLESAGQRWPRRRPWRPAREPSWDEHWREEGREGALKIHGGRRRGGGG